MRSVRLPLMILGAAVLIAYYNSWNVPFLFDDIASIQTNATIKALWPITRSLHPPPELPVSGRPILNLSFAINHAIGGLNVGGYHAINVCIHLVAAFILFGILRRTFAGRPREGGDGGEASWLALAISLLWAVHPMQTMCVTYLTQRAESLMGLFYLLTLYTAIRAATATRPTGWVFTSTICCALGMATKEVMVTAPVVVALYDRVFLCTGMREQIRRRWPLYVGLAGTWAILAWLVLQAPRSMSAGFGFEGPGAWEYLRTQPEVILHYLAQVLWPYPLVLDYAWPIAADAARIIPAAVALLVFLALSVRGLMRRSSAGFAGAAMFLILAPSSSIVPQLIVASEHRMYLPSACMIALVVVSAWRAIRSRLIVERLSTRVRRTGAGLLISALAVILVVLTIRRNQDYQSALSIWADTVAKRSDNPRALTSLGYALATEGRAEEADSLYRRAIELRPDDLDANMNFASQLCQSGRSEEAVKLFGGLAARRPNDWQVHASMGALLVNLNHLGEAVVSFQRALQIRPGCEPALAGLGIISSKLGHHAEAESFLTRVIELRPYDGSLRVQLGIALEEQKKFVEAMSAFRSAIEWNPEETTARVHLARILAASGQATEAAGVLRQGLAATPSSLEMKKELAWVLATSNNERVRSAAEAIRLAESVNDATGRTNFSALDTLAAAYASAGRFDDAVRTANTALELARQNKQEALAQKISTRLELYKKATPYRAGK